VSTQFRTTNGADANVNANRNAQTRGRSVYHCVTYEKTL
jgi:hypothetical protein